MFTPLIKHHSRPSSSSWLAHEPKNHHSSHQTNSLHRKMDSSRKEKLAKHLYASNYHVNQSNPNLLQPSANSSRWNLERPQQSSWMVQDPLAYGTVSASSAAYETLEKEPPPKIVHRPASAMDFAAFLGTSTPQLRRKISTLSQNPFYARLGTVQNMPTEQINHESQRFTPTQMSELEQMGIYGWRKRCLYFLIALLIVFTILNMAVILWLVSFLRVHYSGIGPISLNGHNVTIKGSTQVFGNIFSTRLMPENGEALSIISKREIRMLIPSSIERSSMASSTLAFGETGAQIVASSIHIQDSEKRSLFKARDNFTEFYGNSLRLAGGGGLRLNHSLQTNSIQSFAGESLRLESLTKPMLISSAEGIAITSRSSIAMNSLEDLQIEAKRGDIVFDAYSIRFPKLPRTQKEDEENNPMVMDLCACETTGKLFLSHNGCLQTYQSICELS